MNRRSIVIVAAAVLALGIGFIVYGILTAPKKVVLAPRPVLVSSMRIPLHAHITAAMVEATTQPADAPNTGALMDPSEAVGQVAVADIPQGAPILPAEVARPATPPPDLLRVPVGLRAVTIEIDQVKGLAGLLKPGDHVDVIAVPPRGNGAPAAYSIIRDARVLAVGSQVASAGAVAAAPPAPGAPAPPAPAATAPPTTATLLVTPEEADLITIADLDGQLRLALRSPKEPATYVPSQMMVWPTAQPPAPPAAPRRGVAVISGDSQAMAPAGP